MAGDSEFRGTASALSRHAGFPSVIRQRHPTAPPISSSIFPTPMARRPLPQRKPPKPPGIVWFEPPELPVAFSPAIRRRLAEHCTPESRRDVVQRIRFATFVDPKHKLLYVETPKVASTAILSAFNRLHGEVDIRPFTGLMRETRREMFVHSRKNAVMKPLSAMPPSMQIEILESEEWLRFAFVRDPYTRVFSLWLNKVFIAEPGSEQVFTLLGRDVPARLDRPAASILFDAFVNGIVRRVDLESADQHYRPQEWLLQPDFFNIGFIGKIENFTKDFGRVRAHVRKHGGDLPAPERENRSVEDWRGFYDADLAAIVADVYAADFARFGYATKLDGRSLRAARRKGGIASLESRIDLYNEILKRNRLFAQLYELELGPVRPALRLRPDPAE
jgi:hypothetical protein